MATVIDELMIRLGFDSDTSGASRMESAMGGLAKKAGALFAALGSLATVSSFIETASQFEQFETQLTTIEGSSQKAKASLDWITNFAAKTPYELAQVTEAFVKLKSYGLDAQKGGLLESLGNMASGMGKSLDQAVEAMADAARGENERLKEFGIVGSKDKKSGTVTYSYSINGKDLTKVASGSASSIQKALQEIMDERFRGGMERMSKTWEGTLSNLKDTWTIFKKQVMDAGPFQMLKERLNKVAQWAVDHKEDFTRWAEQIGDAVSRAAKAVGFLWDKLVVLGEATGVSNHLGAIAAALGTLAVLSSPILMVGAAVALLLGVVDDYMTYQSGGDSVIGEILRQYPGLVTLKDNVIALVDTIQDRWKSFSMAAAIIFAPWIAQFILLQTQAALAFGRMLWTAAVNFISMSAMSVVSTGLMIANAYRMMVAWVVSFGEMAIATLAATWPILAIIAAIALVIGAAYLLWSNWETIWEGISNVVGGTIESILINWDSMVSSMTAAWDNAVSWVSAKLEPIFGVIEKIRSAWSSVFSGGDVAMPMPAGAMGGGKVGAQTTVNNSTTVNVPSPAAAAQVVNQTNNNAAAQAQKAATGAKRQ